jgi:hypothetical protein
MSERESNWHAAQPPPPDLTLVTVAHLRHLLIEHYELYGVWATPEQLLAKLKGPQ